MCISGVSHFGSHNHNGVSTQTQKDKTLISYFENPHLSKEALEAKTKEFISLYQNPKNDCTYFPDAKWYRYIKLVYNASLNTVAALTGVDTGRLYLSGGLEAVSIPAMHEVIAIAKADGVELPKDVVNLVVHSDDGEWFEPSMLVDVKKGNPIELEVIWQFVGGDFGQFVDGCKRVESGHPVLSVVYELLKVVQFRLKEGNNMVTVPSERPANDKYFE